MKHTILIIVLTMMLKPVLPVCSYIINYNFIVKELCENKDKPELHCNGKCHLMKEMAKNAEGEKPLSDKKLHQEREVLFLSDIYCLIVEGVSPTPVEKQANEYNNLYKSVTQLSIFHPPSFI